MSELVHRLRHCGRNYAAAAMLNLALIHTVLTPPTRTAVAHTRQVARTPRFRDAELVVLADGSVGVLCAPYAAGDHRDRIMSN